MAKYGSDKVAFLLVDGYSILGANTDVDWTVEATLEETHALGDAWVGQSFVGLRRGTLQQKGFYDDAAGSNNDALVSTNGTSRILCIGIEGNTIGKQFTGFSGAMQAHYKRIAARGTLHKAEAQYSGDGVVEDGKILHTLSTETSAASTTDATPVDNGASTANGGSAYFEVTALTLGGYTNSILRVRHSADNITYVNLLSAAVITASPNAQRVTVAGTVNRYLSSSFGYTGAGAGQSIRFMIGFVRN